MPSILGIKLSSGNEKSTLEKVKIFLKGKRLFYVVTPNPEIILAALKDEELKRILNQADLSLADGFGLKIAGLIKGQKITRITGADLSLKILNIAQTENTKILIINWIKGLSSALEITTILKAKYPNLNCLVLDLERKINLDDKEIETINNFAPKIIFSALGSPYQEKIIFNNLNSWPSARFAIGVGGSFDFLTGKAKRAPKTIRSMGLEWLWRLIQQPQRIKRIYNATIVFPFKVIIATIKGENKNKE